MNHDPEMDERGSVSPASASKGCVIVCAVLFAVLVVFALYWNWRYGK